MSQLRIEGTNVFTFDISNGVPFTDVLNTELRSCLIVVPNVNAIYDIQPLDKAIYSQTINNVSIQKDI